jgi:hypothetical protein
MEIKAGGGHWPYDIMSSSRICRSLHNAVELLNDLLTNLFAVAVQGKKLFNFLPLRVMFAIMSQVLERNAKYAGLIAVTCLSAAVIAFAFAGWQRFSAEIFLSAIESGIAWCL